MYSVERDITPEELTTQVARNLCYELSYSHAKNRVYYTVRGYWRCEEVVPELLKDWGKVLALVQPGYTLVADMRTMVTHPQELKAMHARVQQLLQFSGMLQASYLLPVDKIATLQLQSIHNNPNLPNFAFDTLEEAEMYLDQSLSATSAGA